MSSDDVAEIGLSRTPPRTPQGLVTLSARAPLPAAASSGEARPLRMKRRSAAIPASPSAEALPSPASELAGGAGSAAMAASSSARSSAAPVADSLLSAVPADEARLDGQAPGEASTLGEPDSLPSPAAALAAGVGTRSERASVAVLAAGEAAEDDVDGEGDE